MFEEFEHHAAGRHIGFRQPNADRYAESKHNAADLKTMSLDVMMGPPGAERTRGYKAACPRVVQGHENTEARDAFDSARKGRADPFRQKSRRIAIERIALGQLGAPLGRGYVLAELGEARFGIAAQTIIANYAAP